VLFEADVPPHAASNTDSRIKSNEIDSRKDGR